MREIKFILTVVRDNGYVFSSKQFTLLDFENGNVNTWRKQNSVHDDKTIRYRQFTGLLDKSGKEIYEGDIIEGGLHIGVVEIGIYELHSDRSGFPTWCVNKGKNGKSGFVLTCGKDFKCRETVIGNIYENPELIK